MNDPMAAQRNNVPVLQQLIEVAKADYVNGALVADSEALGRLVAAWANWDGTQILGAFLSALEEANFHGLREEIRQLVTEKGLTRVGDSVEVF